MSLLNVKVVSRPFQHCSLSCLGIFSHNREIWDISPSLHQTTLLGTVSNSVGTDGVARRRASLYEMDVEDSSLKHITDFGAEYSLMDGGNSWNSTTVL